MDYIVTRYIVPTDGGNDTRSQERYTDIVKTKKRWHNIIAADIDNDSIAWELVQIVREDGICVASEKMDNRVPEPAPEVEG
jgi:hypothetical protein